MIQRIIPEHQGKRWTSNACGYLFGKTKQHEHQLHFMTHTLKPLIEIGLCFAPQARANDSLAGLPANRQSKDRWNI